MVRTRRFDPHAGAGMRVMEAAQKVFQVMIVGRTLAGQALARCRLRIAWVGRGPLPMHEIVFEGVEFLSG